MKPRELDQTKVSSADGQYFLVDGRYFPIIVFRFIGKPSEEGIRTYFDWIKPVVDYAEADRKRIIIINDFAEMQAPSAVARKLMADESILLQKKAGFGYWVPAVPNTLLRGVLTAVNWMVGEGSKLTVYTSSVPEAIAKACQLLQDLDQEVPPIDPHTYTPPIVH